jgi:hypothetical protein
MAYKELIIMILNSAWESKFYTIVNIIHDIMLCGEYIYSGISCCGSFSCLVHVRL